MFVTKFKELLTERSGSVAMTFAIVVVFLVMAVGSAVDYGRATAERMRLQNSLDAAVLAAANEFVENKKRKKVFRKTFKSNYEKKYASKLKKLKIKIDPSGKVTGQAKAIVPTTFTAIMNIKNIPINVTSIAERGGHDIEVVLVLDVSGSMRHKLSSGDIRIDALKDSAKKLVDIISGEKQANQKIMFSIVPFTMNVNVGTDNSKFVKNTDHKLFKGTSWAGCVLARRAPDHVKDTPGDWHAYIWPPEPNQNNSCQNPSNGTNNGYQTVEEVGKYGTYSPFTKGPNYNCVRHSIMPLTESVDDTLDKIEDLTSEWNMGTIIAPGVSWGLRALSPNAPFTEGANFNKKTRKIMVVLTDGEQTTERGYYGCNSDQNSTETYKFDPKDFELDGYELSKYGSADSFSPYGYMYESAPLGGATQSWTAVEDKLHETSLSACNEVKKHNLGNKEMEIFTIAVSSSAAPGTRVHNLLKECATSANHSFHVDSATEMENAFKEIAKNAISLRIVE